MDHTPANPRPNHRPSAHPAPPAAQPRFKPHPHRTNRHSVRSSSRNRPATARDFALAGIDRIDLPGWPSNLIHQTLTPPTDPRDLALAEQLTIGIIKNLLHLNHLCGLYTSRPIEKIDPLVRKILILALYQLRFLTRIPNRAIVDEAVKQTRRFGRPGASGFVNAILRNYLRQPDDPTHNIPPDAAPQLLWSHPPELYSRLIALTDPATAAQIAAHNNAEPPIIVRLLPNGSPDQLTGEGITLQPHAQPGFFIVQGARRADFARWSRLNFAQVQDPTSASVIDSCDIYPGQSILDRCAGRGTKTRQIAEQLQGQGILIAADSDPDRIDSLQRMARQQKFGVIRACIASRITELPTDTPRQYDRILMDVPCSNSGVLARRPEARYHQNDRTLASLEQLQQTLLDDTAPLCAPNGRLIYSTCSIWPQENQDAIRQFLTRHPNFRPITQHCTLPSIAPDPAHYHDGGYVAVLERIG